MVFEMISKGIWIFFAKNSDKSFITSDWSYGVKWFLNQMKEQPTN